MPVPDEVAAAGNVLPKVTDAVWLGGVPPVALVKLIVGVAGLTVKLVAVELEPV